jgi:hypothetical protein
VVSALFAAIRVLENARFKNGKSFPRGCLFRRWSEVRR